MGSILAMDSPENETVKNRSFWVQFAGVCTLYVQTPGELYFHGESKVPPEAAQLLLLKLLFGELCKL